MSRRQRLHVAGGTYYVVQHGNAHHPIFSQSDDYALFERLLATGLRRTNARVHGYCWTPAAIHLILQIDEISVGRIMQGLTSRYARSMHRRIGESGHFFRQRYKAVLIDPKHYMLKLVHYLHYIPVLGGLAENPGAAACTSHSSYARQTVTPWLTTRTVARLLEGKDGGTDYDTFMARCPEPEDVVQFERVGSNDLRVIGSNEFMENLPRHSRTYRSKASLDQIIHTVTCRMGVERDLVLSNSRQREFTLVRALIAWYATERGVATLSEVARCLRRDPSTLSMAISRYRTRRPELFKITAMHDISPLVPIGGGSRVHYWDGAAEAREGDDEDRQQQSV
jgi:REP element-mobilizing transposase RayT